MAKKNNAAVYAVALVLFLSGLGYLIFSGLTEDSVYFLNVSEALAEDRTQIKNARLFGKVSPENLVIVDGKLGASFDLIDKMETGKSLRVEFKGALPDTFKDDVEVIVEGTFTPDGNLFKARTLVTKCPSKYEEQSQDMEKMKS
ncbi:Cytochrome c-type biogenesis protein CcmE [Pseudodesulfovibrio profundus]|uniref:Cytochrome c-type biogenesis protein CcmE n=1 Tax=Pseudodesulfovibrio profundus TaxID=57320 RepID=A0A2C8FE90_9BACT|nr:cytochrome c maturation protein CcmE [Pseudodesulfovibrio profundus]MBC16479.1 cytochrome c biogenesis protein CcmE [Desulfovibrio sp.]SOB60783.1 Cytochrome c-type biogenesis protein CcmE [Pseudodesulfovibrio profundus]|tara:strand:- start:549 stop:980 length:432 start_codon:yes stop_codon:yes gene_type:complete